MYNESIWKKYLNTNKYEKLEKDISTDVLIIGAGISGILCAYELKNRNIECVVVEKDKVASKASKDTTAFLTIQHDLLYQDIIKKHGIDKAKEYYNLNKNAIEKYKQLSSIYDFDFTNCNSIMYSTLSNETIIKEKEALDLLNIPCEFIDKIDVDINISLGVKVFQQAKINPIKFINEISKEIKIYEHTKIIKLKGNIAYSSNNYKIKFKKVVIATNYPFINKSGLYFVKLTQRRSYLVAIENKDINDTYCCVDENGLYFRTYNNHLIIAGYDKDSKKKCNGPFIDKIKNIIKDKKVIYNWSGQDCISLDNIPYIGKYDMFHDNYYIITGFNLWGYTWAMASSTIIADLIEKNIECKLVNPNRSMMNKQLFINLGVTLKNLFTLKKPRCTHMYGALNYNKQEKVWECPIHGSRFTKDGKILDGPALKDLYYKKKL